MNVIKTFKESDQLDLQSFSSRLGAFIKTENYFVEGGLVISLNAPFGAGKSTFIEMWQQEMLASYKDDQTLPLPILVNAWEDDYCGDPMLSLVRSLSATLLRNQDQSSKKKGEKLKETAKDVAWLTLGLANEVASKFTGIDVIAGADVSEKKRKERNAALECFEERVRVLKRIRTTLADVFGGAHVKAIIMVDELDRCRPSYAIDYLETIKHVFNVKGLAFVLAVDKHQLRSSAKAMFGSDLNFDEYYRKFVHRNVELPAPTEESLRRLIRHYASTILEIDDGNFKRTTRADLRNITNDLAEIMGGLRLTPRQINEVFRLIGHAFATSKANPGEIWWAYNSAFMLLASLAVGLPDIYHRIGKHLATNEDFALVLNTLSKDRKHFWGSLLLTGYDDSEEEKKLRMSEFARLDLISGDTEEERMRELASSSRGWGYGQAKKGIATTYSFIENINIFADH